MDFLATMPVINLIILLIFIIVFAVLMAHLLKGKDIKFGKASITEKQKTETRINERDIIKRQVHIARAVCSNFKIYVPHYNKYDQAVIENTCYKVADVIEDLIFFNHLSDDKSYIDSRFECVWEVIVDSLNGNFTEEDKAQLKDISYEHFERLVDLLLTVRQERE